MREVWNKVYQSDSTFFGEESSNFALLCFNNENQQSKVPELGAGHGRGSIFFASNGLEIAAELLNKITRKKSLPLKPHFFDVKHQLTYPDGHFDAAYSHALPGIGLLVGN